MFASSSGRRISGSGLYFAAAPTGQPDGPLTPDQIAAQYIDLIFNGLGLPSRGGPPPV
jgi:hypothetical protein